MKKTFYKLITLGLTACFIIVISHACVAQKSETVNKQEWANKAKEAFLHAWNGYKKYAWGHDQLKPLSHGYYDWYSRSLLMTPVDAYDTMKLMHLDKEAAEAKKLIVDSLSFNVDSYVSNFEITIRMLGGLLSSYEIDHDQRFLDLAHDLGNRLLPAFDTPTGMPYEYINLKTGKTKGDVNSSAEIGTLILEFGTLSKLTHDPVYYNKAKKAMVALYNHRSSIGLVGTTINVKTGKWVNTDSHVSGGIDSYYEYLIKAWKLFGDKDFKTMYDNTLKSVNKYVRDSVSTGVWYGHVDMNTGKRTATHFGALDAFFPAVLALGGDMHDAKLLEASCYKMWMVAGVEPEQLDYSDMKIINPSYALRPENLESAYYMYHYTKDPVYLKRGRDMFASILKYCRTDDGFTALKDVRTKDQQDYMESFLFAETFKYAYLLFAPPSTLDFNKIIFNTEAHPYRRDVK